MKTPFCVEGGNMWETNAVGSDVIPNGRSLRLLALDEWVGERIHCKSSLFHVTNIKYEDKCGL